MNKYFCLGTIRKPAEIKTFQNGGKNAKVFVEILDRRWDSASKEMAEVLSTIEFEAFDSKSYKTASKAEAIPVGTQVLCEARITVDTWADKNTGQDRQRQKLSLQEITPLGGSSQQGQSAPAAALGGRF